MGCTFRVYPRACGGTERLGRARDLAQGLSPRLRGNGSRSIAQCLCPGSIPALAGERRAGSRVCAASGVYPRACGGTLL